MTMHLNVGDVCFDAPSLFYGTKRHAVLGWKALLNNIIYHGWDNAVRGIPTRSFLTTGGDIILASLRRQVTKSRAAGNHWWLQSIGLTRPFGDLVNEKRFCRDWNYIVDGTNYLWFTLGLIYPQHPESFPILSDEYRTCSGPAAQMYLRKVLSGIVHWLPEILALSNRFALTELPSHLMSPLSWAAGIVWYCSACGFDLGRRSMDEISELGNGDIVTAMIRLQVIETCGERFRLIMH